MSSLPNNSALIEIEEAIRKAKEIHERRLRKLAAQTEFNPFEACPGCEGAPLEETDND